MLKQKIFNAALTLSSKRGPYRFTRHEVAQTAQVGNGSINYHYGSMDSLRDEVIDYAVKNEVLAILAWVLGDHRITGRIKPALKSRVAAFIATR